MSKNISMCLFTVFAGMVLMSSASAFTHGSGTLQDPYWIESASDWSALVLYSPYWSQHFKLTANIDLSGLSSVKVATKTIPFTGSLDGQDFTISNFTIDKTTFDYVGLFTYVGTNMGSITHSFTQGTVGAGINVKNDIGGLVGYNAGTLHPLQRIALYREPATSVV